MISFDSESSCLHFVLFNVIMVSLAHAEELRVIIKLNWALSRPIIEYVGKHLKRAVKDHWSSASYHFTNFFMCYGFRSTSRSMDSGNYFDNYDIVYLCFVNPINEFHIDWHLHLHTSCLQLDLGSTPTSFITIISFSSLLAILI